MPKSLFRLRNHNYKFTDKIAKEFNQLKEGWNEVTSNRTLIDFISANISKYPKLNYWMSDTSMEQNELINRQIFLMKAIIHPKLIKSTDTFFVRERSISPKHLVQEDKIKLLK